MLSALASTFAQTYYTISTEDPTVTTASDGFSAGFIVVILLLVVVYIVAYWKIFTKARQPGWASIVPIYNIIVMLRIIGQPWWWLLLLFIPFVNIVISIIMTYALAKAFGKSIGYTIFMLILPIIAYPMLAFGKSKYHGPPKLNFS